MPLTLDVKCSDAWRALSPQARLVYLELRGELNRDPRINNGSIFLSNRDAAEAVGISQRTAWKAFHELQAKGFIVATEVGHLGVQGTGRATCYRITECGTRESYEGTKDYRRWSPGNDFMVAKGKAPVSRGSLPPADDNEHQADAVVVPMRRGGVR